MQAREKDSLAKNTLMLYLLTGSNYFFGLITVPYLTRTLGPDTYGIIGFAASFSAIVQLVLEFGFQLSAVIDIANCQDNLNEQKRIVSAVTYAKVLLIIPSFIIVTLICIAVDRFRSYPLLFILYFIYAALNSLVPDFYYRGMENMSSVTLRNVTVKAVFCIFVILFVKDSTQFVLVPVFYIIGSLAGLLVVLRHMKNVMNVWFIPVKCNDIVNQFQRAALFFISRAASSIYSSFNAIVLGMLFPVGPIVGYYSACNQMINVGRQAITPITGSFFPHIVRTKNFSLLLRVLFFGEIVLITGSILVGVFSEQICVILFGMEYRNASVLLRLLLPLIPITLATYLFGWSGLGALNLESITNVSNIVGAIIQAAGLVFCIIDGFASAEFICLLTVASESVVLAIRAIAFFHGLSEFSKEASNA